MIRPEDIQVPQISVEEIWALADEFRAEQGEWGNRPVDIERILDLNLGFTIQTKRKLKEKTGTDAMLLAGDKKVIAVDYDEFHDPGSWPMLHFSMAHELGHYLLHKVKFDIYKDANFQNVDDWVAFLNAIPLDVHFNLEQQANQFAGRLMVPKDELMEKLEEALYKKGLRPPVSDEDFNAVTSRLGRKFGVSSKCIEVRMDRESINIRAAGENN